MRRKRGGRTSISCACWRRCTGSLSPGASNLSRRKRASPTASSSRTSSARSSLDPPCTDPELRSRGAASAAAPSRLHAPCIPRRPPAMLTGGERNRHVIHRDAIHLRASRPSPHPGRLREVLREGLDRHGGGPDRGGVAGAGVGRAVGAGGGGG